MISFQLVVYVTNIFYTLFPPPSFFIIHVTCVCVRVCRVRSFLHAYRR